MNVLADFIVRVQEQFPEEIENEELNSLLLTIRNQSAEIDELNKEVKNLRNNILNYDEDDKRPAAKRELKTENQNQKQSLEGGVFMKDFEMDSRTQSPECSIPNS